MTSVVLMDAYERRVYAQYMWSTKTGKKYWEIPPMQCDVTPTAKQTTTCSSRDEFDGFVAKYMED